MVHFPVIEQGLLIISSILVVLIGIAITLIPSGGLFGIVPLTLPYFLIIGALVAGYLVVVEIVKKGFTEILLTAWEENWEIKRGGWVRLDCTFHRAKEVSSFVQ